MLGRSEPHDVAIFSHRIGISPPAKFTYTCVASPCFCEARQYTCTSIRLDQGRPAATWPQVCLSLVTDTWHLETRLLQQRLFDGSYFTFRTTTVLKLIDFVSADLLIKCLPDSLRATYARKHKQGIFVWFPTGTRDFLQNIKTGSGVHPASYSMCFTLNTPLWKYIYIYLMLIYYMFRLYRAVIKYLYL